MPAAIILETSQWLSYLKSRQNRGLVWATVMNILAARSLHDLFELWTPTSQIPRNTSLLETAWKRGSTWNRASLKVAMKSRKCPCSDSDKAQVVEAANKFFIYKPKPPICRGSWLRVGVVLVCLFGSYEDTVKDVRRWRKLVLASLRGLLERGYRTCKLYVDRLVNGLEL